MTRRNLPEAYRVCMTRCAEIITAAGCSLGWGELAPAFAGLPHTTAHTMLSHMVRRGWLEHEPKRRKNDPNRYRIGECWLVGALKPTTNRDPMRHALHLLGTGLAVQVHNRHAGQRVLRDVERIASGARELALEALADALALDLVPFRFEPRRIAAGGAA